jgi:hypothetical protein
VPCHCAISDCYLPMQQSHDRAEIACHVSGLERLGRHVIRGQKALVLCVSITRKEPDPDAIAEDDPRVFIVYRSRWFVLR